MTTQISMHRAEFGKAHTLTVKSDSNRKVHLVEIHDGDARSDLASVTLYFDSWAEWDAIVDGVESARDAEARDEAGKAMRVRLGGGR